MSETSYIDAIRPKLVAEEMRARSVEAIVAMLGSIVRDHFEFDDDGDEPLQTRPVNLNPDDPDEIVWFRILDAYGDEIERTRTEGITDMASLVGSAAFRISSNSPNRSINTTAFTIVTEPPEVLGYDGTPLELQDLDSVTVDLRRYNEALIAT